MARIVSITWMKPVEAMIGCVALVESLLEEDGNAARIGFMETDDIKINLPTSTLADRRLNKRVGPYLISKRIGRGGMGRSLFGVAYGRVQAGSCRQIPAARS